MSELNITLTKQQQEILLRGLRYVRSAKALDAVEWSPEVEAEREQHYSEVAELEGLLNGATIVESTTPV